MVEVVRPVVAALGEVVGLLEFESSVEVRQDMRAAANQVRQTVRAHLQVWPVSVVEEVERLLVAALNIDESSPARRHHEVASQIRYLCVRLSRGLPQAA